MSPVEPGRVLTVEEVRDLVCACPNPQGRHHCDLTAERIVQQFDVTPKEAEDA